MGHNGADLRRLQEQINSANRSSNACSTRGDFEGSEPAVAETAMSGNLVVVTSLLGYHVNHIIMYKLTSSWHAAAFRPQGLNHPTNAPKSFPIQRLR